MAGRERNSSSVESDVGAELEEDAGDLQVQDGMAI